MKRRTKEIKPDPVEDPEKTKVRQNEKSQNFDSGNKVKQVEQKQNPKMTENSTKVNFFYKRTQRKTKLSGGRESQHGTHIFFVKIRKIFFCDGTTNYKKARFLLSHRGRLSFIWSRHTRELNENETSLVLNSTVLQTKVRSFRVRRLSLLSFRSPCNVGRRTTMDTLFRPGFS